MSAPPKRPSPVPQHQRNSNTSNPVVSLGPTRSSTGSTAGFSRARFGRGGKGSLTSPTRTTSTRPEGVNLAANGTTSPSESLHDDTELDAKAEAATLLEDLKEQLRKAEIACEGYRRQIDVLQNRLDDALKGQEKLEDQMHEVSKVVSGLELEKKDMVRQRRELEALHEAERASMLQDKEQMTAQEQELRFTIQRLKESLSQKDQRKNSLEESFNADNEQNPGQAERGVFSPHDPNDARSGSVISLQMNGIIESLRLELAEAHLKLVESESLKSTRTQELENSVVEIRRVNARLMEENESFQLLLREKTLNGDFSRAHLMNISNSSAGQQGDMSNDGLGSSLADELESADNEAGDVERMDRRAELEIKSLKDQNKALTLYINTIIERVLQHKDFETILDKTQKMPTASRPTPSRLNSANIDKDLPPPPPPADEPSTLQRGRSIAGASRRLTSRPLSLAFFTTPTPPGPSGQAPTNSSFLDRSQSVRHSQLRRTNADSAPPPATEANPASVDNQPDPPPPEHTNAETTLPPRTSSMIAPFNTATLTGTTIGTSVAPPRRTPSSRTHADKARSASNGSGASHGRGSDAEPPNPAVAAPPAPLLSTSASIAGTKLRPLRLVQESNKEVEAAKKARRSSWMGWFNKGPAEEAPASSSSSSAAGPMRGEVVRE